MKTESRQSGTVNTLIKNQKVFVLSLIGFILPIYVRGIAIDQSDIEIEVLKSITTPFNIDIFGASKARMLLFLVLLLTVQFLFLFLKDKISLKLHWSFIFVGIYVFGIA